MNYSQYVYTISIHTTYGISNIYIGKKFKYTTRFHNLYGCAGINMIMSWLHNSTFTLKNFLLGVMCKILWCSTHNIPVLMAVECQQSKPKSVILEKITYKIMCNKFRIEPALLFPLRNY